jgi:hypothetical protein
MTSIEWLIEQFKDYDFLLSLHQFDIEQAKEMHKQEIIDAYYEGKSNGMDISHPLSLTKEISFEEYYQETFVSKGSDECQFEPTTNTSSATICKHCGREKFLHKL